MTPSCSLVDPIMTRTSRARIRPFTRICGCRLDQSPQRRTGVHRAAVLYLSQFQASAFTNATAPFLRHGCDSPQRSARIKVRKPKRSCREQFRAGKINLVTIRFRSPVNHFAGGSPKCALCAAYAAASSSMESKVAANGSSFTTPEKMARSPISLSITNAGRCVICNARNSAVDARIRFSIAGDFARSSNLSTLMPAASAPVSATICQSAIFFPSRSAARASASRTRSSVKPKSFAASATQFGASHSGRLASYQFNRLIFSSLLNLNHIFLFLAIVSPLLVLARAWRPSAPYHGWRLAALVVLAVTGCAWLLWPKASGYIGGTAWFLLLFLPAIALRKITELAAHGQYKSAGKLGAALPILHPTAELREQVRLFRRLKSNAAHPRAFSSVPDNRDIDYGSRRSQLRSAPAVLVLILANVLVFLFEISVRHWNDPRVLHRIGALEPHAVVSEGEYWRLFTALFLHGGFLHLAFNLFALYFLGPPLERSIGTMRFFACYLISW